MAIVTTFSDPVRATPAAWQTAMKTAIRSGVELCLRLQLPAENDSAAVVAERLFPVFAPLSFVGRMRIGDPDDPLLRQVLPLKDETIAKVGFVADPVGDLPARKSSALLHKYQGRALLITNGSCAVHCRYCFRREFPYQEGGPADQKWNEALTEIAADDSIHEIILSGGDPLTAVDDRLKTLVERVADIEHVKRLRVHSRLPIVIPERVTAELLDWMRGTRLTPIMVIHANHAQEIDEAVAQSLARLVDAGIPVLNQAVLLRGVNDSVDALSDLCNRLIDLRVMPYYLHQLDRVAGAWHFEVPIEDGRRLIEELRCRLPGYAVPRYVLETPGDLGKSWL